MSRKSAKKRARIYKYGLVIGAFFVLTVFVWQGGNFFWWQLPGAADSPVLDEPVPVQAAFAPFAGESNYPVLIMLDNSPESRPYQEGLDKALVVYETLVEGGATRLAGLFAGAPLSERIGPVRSARPYFVDIAAGWSAFYWHAGGSPEALALLNKSELTSLNEISGLGPKYLWRDKSIARPHNLFTSDELIAQALKDFELHSLQQEKLTWRWDNNFSYPSSPPASKINIDYSPIELYDASFEYNSEQGVYNRGQNSVVAAANVIVQKIPAERYYPSGEGRLKLDLIGDGEMLLFRDGQVISGRWRKESFVSQTEWFDSAGGPLSLKPGQTWVEIVPGARDVIYK